MAIMILAVLVGIVIALIGIKHDKEYYKTQYNTPTPMPSNLLVIFIGAMVGLFIGGIILMIVSLTIVKTHYVESYRKQLVSMKDLSRVNGSFFLGSGRIGSVEYYSYYYKLSDNAYKKGMVPVWRVDHIEESDNKTPVIIAYDKHPVSKYGYLYSVTPPKRAYTIIMPKDSIRQNFKLE